MSIKVIVMLREYYKIHRSSIWLFEAQEHGTQYSETNLQKVLKQALDHAKIKKTVTLHWLRHSYTTHLFEAGTDFRYIQELLGILCTSHFIVIAEQSEESINPLFKNK